MARDATEVERNNGTEPPKCVARPPLEERPVTAASEHGGSMTPVSLEMSLVKMLWSGRSESQVVLTTTEEALSDILRGRGDS